ncbi:MAG: RNA methyltransferase [Oscillospiraceae bacterium]|jgi:TrmH family RNA methyltransferase|nr:RNA methyltransferase [Oscillospiraceae bacterium]
MTDKITSRQNAVVQKLRKLFADASYRRDSGLFAGAGGKLREDYLSAGGVESGVYTSGEMTPDLLSYITGMQSPPDCVFYGEIPKFESPDFARCLILEDVQDPGNVGTMIRSAAAFGIDAVILAGDCADPWQLKVLRGSMGAVFRQPLLTLDCEQVHAVLERGKLPLYSAVAHGGEDVREVRLPERFAIAIGNEGHGLRQSTLDNSAGLIRIPISAESESLNAAAAASILLWELVGRK